MQSKLPLPTITKLTVILLTLVSLFISGCGGGGGGSGGGPSTSGTLSGVAAVGSPIVNGNIHVICAAGSAPASTATNSTGSWSVTLSGQTLPCAVQVSGGTINGSGNTTSYHSVALSAGTVNVTPLTDLLVANLTGAATPAAWFAGLGSAPGPLASINQTKVDTALANLNAALPALPLYTSTTNPITASFTPVAGNTYDDMLTALHTAMTNASITYPALLGSAAASGFAPPSGLASALSSAYQGTASGGSATYFPVNGPITTFNANSVALTMMANVNGHNLVYTVTDTLSASQIFLGQSANTTATTGTVAVDGSLIATLYSTNYFSVAPYKNLGSSSPGTGLYTVYANQIALPATATIGSGGDMDTGTDYTDNTQSVILDTFTETWALTTGLFGTAELCVYTVTTAVSSSATSGSSYYCLNIDNNGQIISAQISGPLIDTNLTLTSNSIITTPGAPTISSVIAGASSAIVYITPPTNLGGAQITGYTVTAIPSPPTLLGNVTATGSSSPIQITNLTAGTSYTFTAVATNSMGSGDSSLPSSSVTPTVGTPAGYVSQGGLIWMPLTSTYYTYAQAVTLCSGTFMGLSGWRLPTEQELINLANSGAMNGQGWVLGTYLWSSTSTSVGSYDLVYLPIPYLFGSFSATNSSAATCVH